MLPWRELRDSLRRMALKPQCTCVGSDQLFVRVHDAVRHCEDAEAGLAGAVNGFSHQRNGSSENHIEEAKELLLPRSSIDCV